MDEATTTGRRVLIVTYHFPPDREVGALRSEKFFRYLPEFGWQPEVLTVDPRYYSCPQRLSMILGVQRTRVLPTARDLYRVIRQRLWTRALRNGTTDVGSPRDAQESNGLFSTVKRTVSSLAYWPDCAAGWLGPGVVAARRAMRRVRYLGLITTGPPHTAHLIGLGLRRHGLRWIVDLRDPWVGNPGTIGSAASEALDRQCERVVFRRANAIVVGTNALREQVVRRYPDLAQSVHVISGGIDPEDFERIPRIPASKFRVAHIGTLYLHRSPEILFVALKNLIEAGRLPRDQVEIVFAGTCEEFDPTELARRYKLEDLLRMPGLIPRHEALAIMASAGALVLLAQYQPLQIPAKSYEYLAAGAPIIAVAEPGATAELIALSSAAWVVDPKDHSGMCQALLGAFATWQQRLHAGGTDVPTNVLRPFNQPLPTARLVALLEGTTVKWPG